jgi:hypothetical protein
VGAWREDGTGANSGAVYRFNADPESSEFGQLIDDIPAPFGMNYEQFGTSLAAGPDGILVGAIGTFTVGATYLYSDSAAAPLDARVEAVAAVPEPSGAPLALCGIALWLAGRWDGRRMASHR